MMKKFLSIAVALVALVLLAGNAVAANVFFNGFETDTSNWFDFAGGTVTRVVSGTDSTTSADGDYHATIDGPVYTDWGSYSSTFPRDGYVTELDIYLDMTEADGSDKRFDFSSAVSTPSNTHRKDFIFNVGTNPGVIGEWVVSASNNAPGWPSNPGRNPVIVDQTGWYTFRHNFINDSGVLLVEMELLDQSENVVGSWSLSDPSDVIGTTVGGNRYGWFTSQRFDFNTLAIDNSALYTPDTEAPDVEITNPADGTYVYGMVDIRGSVVDDSPDHYWLVVQDSDGNTVAGPGVVYEYDSFTDELLFTWDTSTMDDDEYTVKLEARDEFDNKDSGSVDWHTVIVNNTPDNKDQCKNGGWENFTNPVFKNQGDCVSYLMSSEKAQGNKNK